MKDLVLSEIQNGSSTNSVDSIVSTSASKAVLSSPTIPNLPQSTPSSTSSSTNVPPMLHDTIPHNHLNSRTAPVSNIPQHHLHAHLQHIDSHMTLHQPQHVHAPQNILHSNHHPNQTGKSQIDQHPMQMSNDFTTPMDQYDQNTFNSQYSASTVVHPTMNSQHSSEYNDSNYYSSSFYASYDDQLRPYSASSNSCSSSNSDGDSQMTPHSHHSMHPTHGNQANQSQHHGTNQPGSLLPSGGNQANSLSQTNGSLDSAANLSPTEYNDCMEHANRSSHHTFELNCFGGIGNVNIHSNDSNLHSNYMHEFGKIHHNHHIGIVEDHGINGGNHTSILLNGNANSGGSVVFNGNDLSGISDSIQYTSVIVEPNNFHMTNEYVH